MPSPERAEPRRTPAGREPEPLKADGETCSNDNECINACVALACTGDSNEGSCAGECGLLETVPFVPDEDEDNEAPPEVPACNEINASCSNGGGCCGDADCECVYASTAGESRCLRCHGTAP